jgi:SAM-dependent methyltransferase
LDLLDIVNRITHPPPWSEGDNIPWNDPAFSQRMLKEHLSQDHDAASRRETIIDLHVEWIRENLLPKKKSHILDLGCGPGLYSVRLARSGHTCIGIDYSPASIQYARKLAAAENLNCTFLEEDIRQAAFGDGYNLAMLIYGELNVFKKEYAELILQKIAQSLCPGGKVLLEVHTYEAVKEMGLMTPSWFTSSSGLFSPNPHICLTENSWHEETAITTRRHYVIEAETAKVTRIAQSFQAYDEFGYRELLRNSGFEQMTFLPSLTGSPAQAQKELIVITASRPYEKTY